MKGIDHKQVGDCHLVRCGDSVGWFTVIDGEHYGDWITITEWDDDTERILLDSYKETLAKLKA